MAIQYSHLPADESESLVEQTIGDLLRAAAADVGGLTFLVDGIAEQAARTRLTYAECARRSENMARFLRSKFQVGEHIAVWAPNSLEWILLEFAAALAGTPLVMINPALKDEEVQYILRQSCAVALFLVEHFRDNPLLEIAKSVSSDLPHLREILLFEDWQEYESRGIDCPLPKIGCRQAAMIQYTSGTTGSPKGAVLSHFGVVNDARFVEARLTLRKHSVWLLSTPLFHTGGSVYHLLSALWNRGILVVMGQFDAALLIDLVEQEKVNFFSAVPTVHLKVVEHSAFRTDRVASLKIIGSGGSTVPEDFVHRLERDYGAHYLVTFGQTETSASITHSRLSDSTDQKAKTVGTPLPWIELKVVDVENSEVVRSGVQGEICVRGFCVMLEYFDSPEQTRQTIDADGWLHTGDIGVLRDDGYLQITGRLKDMIRSGGESVFPRDIEEWLAKHPSVAEACVIGVPDRMWGERVAAVVQFAHGSTASAEHLERFLRDRIAGHKVPKQWRFVDEFPRTPTGKIKKYMLKDLFQS